MYSNEILFVDKFLAKLEMMNVEFIPFLTVDYNNGVRAMKIYFNEHIDELDGSLSDIGLLFLNGGREDFADAIMARNGEKISLQNPRLEKANIKKTGQKAQISLDNHRINIPDDFLTAITNEFCMAAGII